jgi:hypothetical protein
MKLESEDKIQSDCWQWLWNYHPRTRRLFFSIPLGGLRLPREAARLQATGALAGTPDTLLSISGSYRGKKYPVAFIEFKTPDGKLNAFQKIMIPALESAGNLVMVIRSLEDFKKFIYEYLDGSEYLIP